MRVLPDPQNMARKARQSIEQRELQRNETGTTQTSAAHFCCISDFFFIFSSFWRSGKVYYSAGGCEKLIRESLHRSNQHANLSCTRFNCIFGENCVIITLLTSYRLVSVKLIAQGLKSLPKSHSIPLQFDFKASCNVETGAAFDTGLFKKKGRRV